jgi:hypothetical protein
LRTTPEIEVEITFLPPEEGGRRQPPDLASPARYMPHLVVGDPNQRKANIRNGNVIDEEYLGVVFMPDAAPVVPGVARAARLGLMYHPQVNYERVVPGATFTLREGGRVVAFGKVLARNQPPP